MGNSETKLQIVVDAQNNTASAFNSVNSSLSSLTSSMKTIGTYGAVAFAAVSAEMYKAVDVAMQMQNQQAQLNAVIASTGDISGATVAGINALAESLQQTTGYSRDTIIQIDTLLIGFKDIGENVIPGATQAILDFAARTGNDAVEAANMLGKALANPAIAVGALTREHVVLTDAQKDAIAQFVKVGDTASAQQVIIEALTQTFSGAAEQTNTLTYQHRLLQSQLEQMQIQIGTTLLPILTKLLAALEPILEKVANWVQEHPKLTEALILGTVALTAMMAVLLPLSLILPGLVTMFGLFAVAMAAISLPALAVIASVTAIITILSTLAAKGDLTKQAWEEVWLGIEEIAASAVNSIISGVQNMINFIINGVNKAIDAINSVLSIAQRLPGVGSLIPSIGQLSTVNLGQINPDTIASSSILASAGSAAVSGAAITMTGNVFLSPDVAEQIGDMIVKKLGLSNLF